MHPFEKEILAVIRQEKLLDGGEIVVVGVSGGPDSMALLHVLAALAPLLRIKVIAAHVNHGLRPDEAETEKVLVEQEARCLSVACESVAVDVPAEARKRKISIEHAARDLRYGFFADVAGKYGADRIAVAHTADDQAEEVLLRLIRGTGRTGLAGMRMIRDKTIIRPLLTIAKDTLLAYLADRKIPFSTDSSNLEKISAEPDTA